MTNWWDKEAYEWTEDDADKAERCLPVLEKLSAAQVALRASDAMQQLNTITTKLQQYRIIQPARAHCKLNQIDPAVAMFDLAHELGIGITPDPKP